MHHHSHHSSHPRVTQALNAQIMGRILEAMNHPDGIQGQMALSALGFGALRGEDESDDSEDEAERQSRASRSRGLRGSASPLRTTPVVQDLDGLVTGKDNSFVALGEPLLGGPACGFVTEFQSSCTAVFVGVTSASINPTLNTDRVMYTPESMSHAFVATHSTGSVITFLTPQPPNEYEYLRASPDTMERTISHVSRFGDFSSVGTRVRWIVNAIEGKASVYVNDELWTVINIWEYRWRRNPNKPSDSEVKKIKWVPFIDGLEQGALLKVTLTAPEKHRRGEKSKDKAKGEKGTAKEASETEEGKLEKSESAGEGTSSGEATTSGDELTLSGGESQPGQSTTSSGDSASPEAAAPNSNPFSANNYMYYPGPLRSPFSFQSAHPNPPPPSPHFPAAQAGLQFAVPSNIAQLVANQQLANLGNPPPPPPAPAAAPIDLSNITDPTALAAALAAALGSAVVPGA